MRIDDLVSLRRSNTCSTGSMPIGDKLHRGRNVFVGECDSCKRTPVKRICARIAKGVDDVVITKWLMTGGVVSPHIESTRDLTFVTDSL